MSTLTEASDAPVVRVVNDVTHEFPKLTRKQVGGLTARWAAEDRARVLAVLDAGKISEPIRADKLIEFDRDSRGISYGLRCMSELSRADEVLELSKPGADTSFVTMLDIVDLACEVWGWKVDLSADPNRKPETPAP